MASYGPSRPPFSIWPPYWRNQCRIVGKIFKLPTILTLMWMKGDASVFKINYNTVFV